VEGLTHALARLAALPLRAKLVAAAVLLGLSLALAAGIFATRDARVALFATPLRSDQLAEVETRLAAWRIPYAPLADNVRVEPRRRADVLLRLALAGIPHPHLAGSAEALAHVGALTPQSVLEAQTRDALAADLAQGLRGLDGVADARVIVAPARGGIYADEPARDASASVRIALAPGAHLAAATVTGIRAFVAGGVPGLDPSHVTVLDDRGVLDGTETAARDGGAIEAALQSALDAAFGTGATIVRVHREPAGETRELHDVRRVALGGALTRSAGDERYAGEKKRYAKLTTSEERGSETRDERRTAAPEATARISVAIFVDAARALDTEKIRAYGEAAAGIDRRRGDALRIEAVRFAVAGPAPANAFDAWAVGALVTGMIPQLALVAGAIVLVALGARPAYALAVRVVERAAVRSAAGASAGLPPARVRGALIGEPPHVAAAVISALPAATATAVLDLYPPEERAQIVRRLARAAAELVPPVEELLRGRA
jgi:flagellar M-ring protein FliF